MRAARVSGGTRLGLAPGTFDAAFERSALAAVSLAVLAVMPVMVAHRMAARGAIRNLNLFHGTLLWDDRGALVRRGDGFSLREAGSMGDRKSGGTRSCYNKSGSPKSAFRTKKLAERAIPRTSVRLAPYACTEHGWHLGHRP
jgi:hypothetical protein